MSEHPQNTVTNIKNFTDIDQSNIIESKREKKKPDDVNIKSFITKVNEFSRMLVP